MDDGGGLVGGFPGGGVGLRSFDNLVLAFYGVLPGILEAATAVVKDIGRQTWESDVTVDDGRVSVLDGSFR